MIFLKRQFIENFQNGLRYVFYRDSRSCEDGESEEIFSRKLSVLDKKHTESGYVVVSTLVFATVAIIILTGLTSWAALNYRAVIQTTDREKAFQIAEAGIDYYRWHLAHSPLDFKDGTATSGPYIHPYYDKMGNHIGQFELSITPPSVGSTVVKIASEGVVASTSISRTIEATMAIPSLAKYAFVANSFMRFGQGTEVFGPIHSNSGVRFDGLAHNIIASAISNYNDPDHTGSNEWGVHTHVYSPPASGVSSSALSSEIYSAIVSPPVRNDVFISGRQFPVPAVDWSNLTQDLSTLKTLAQSSGHYIASSGSQGYKIVLKTNNTFDLYKVTSLTSPPRHCEVNNGVTDQDGWGSWTINRTTFVNNYVIPANGIVFVEDHVWVEGQIDGSRVTIASGRFPESSTTNTSITFNNDILYSNFDGSDVIALIAQENINAGLQSADDLEVDAALVAKNGRVGRYFYDSDCDPYDVRTKIRLFGMIASNLRYGFAYSGSSNTGYITREIVYDANLLYGPPPSFPLTSDSYVTIGWREI